MLTQPVNHLFTYLCSEATLNSFYAVPPALETETRKKDPDYHNSKRGYT